MSKVLTFCPSENANAFLTYTEKTVHTEHGEMYKVTTESGHSICATDDHSLATVGSNDFFSPIPPQDSLGSFLPITLSMDYDRYLSPSKEDINKVVKAIVSDTFEPEDYLLNLPVSFIYPYVLCGLDRLDWKYKSEDKNKIDLLATLLSRIGVTYTLKDNCIECDMLGRGYVPEDGKLVTRGEARKTNVYKRLPYTWSQVVSVEKVAREDITYDFTVPEYPLFIGNNILVYDTMQLHVPVTEEARVEALNQMLPSKNLFSARTLDPMMLPQQESIYGLYEASTPCRGKAIMYTDIKKLRRDIETDKIKPNYPVTIAGHKTTAGIAVINSVVPDNLRNYTSKWDKKVVGDILKKVGKSHPNVYAHVADEIKEIGALFAYKLGCSFKASDFVLDKERGARDQMFATVDKQIATINAGKGTDANKYKDKVSVLRAAQTFNQSLTNNAITNTFHKWAYSGARGSKSQVMQIIASPTIVSDPRDKVVPIAIKTSYLEGISPADYWVSSYGTRKGTVSAKLSVAPGGALAKEIIGNVLDIVISEHDCHTRNGITLPVDNAHRKDIVERYEAGTNKFIDDRVFETMLRGGKKTVVVRSPIKCTAQHGVCQLCYGYNEKGKLPAIGENVGVVAAQAVTEPLTQMGLSSKHTAGTAAVEKVGLNTIKQFFTMPNTAAGAALIAGASGVVSKIEPGAAGGTDVSIGRKKYHAAPGVVLKVTVGQKVEAGDIMSSGVPNLKKIVPFKGIAAGRETFVNSAVDLYSRADAPSIRKNFETIARGLVNYAKISHPGDSGYVEGDVVDYNELQGDIEKGHKASKMYVAPKYTPVQAGTTYAPQYKTDWLANFGFKYLKQNMIENAATGAKSDLHSYHPIAGYAAAANFGKGKDGRY